MLGLLAQQWLLEVASLVQVFKAHGLRNGFTLLTLVEKVTGLPILRSAIFEDNVSLRAALEQLLHFLVEA